MDYPIVHDPGSIDMLLRTVSRSDPPELVNHDYLVELGFKREIDEGLLRLLSFLGFIDDAGRPTDLWVDYNDPDTDAEILRSAIRGAYGDLFSLHPRAYDREGTVLMDFFRTSAGASDNHAAYMILTFKVLCDLAEMGEEDTGSEPRFEEEPAPAPAKKKKEPKQTPPPPAGEEPREMPALRLSLSMDLDAEADPELRELVMKLLRRQMGSLQ